MKRIGPLGRPESGYFTGSWNDARGSCLTVPVRATAPRWPGHDACRRVDAHGPPSGYGAL